MTNEFVNANGIPLAERMRPIDFNDFVGQDHLFGEKSAFVAWLNSQTAGNVILYGPPGCGKTTLAKLIAKKRNKQLMQLNAVLSNLTELREKLRIVENSNGRALLFIDEIHRFNSTQQDALLPFCEAGSVQIIGATTRNPAFYIIQPLLSRSYLFELKSINNEAVVSFLQKTISNKQNGLGALNIDCEKNALTLIANAANGDLRKAMNFLEYITSSIPVGGTLSYGKAKELLDNQMVKYSARESDHFDIMSAFIKSVRGCDADAALYWLARMILGGEDPVYVARRLVILASEDVGLADSRGLGLATAALSACEKIGLPECGIPLAHVTVFLTLAPKSNSAYLAWNKACECVKNGHMCEVPDYLKKSPISTSQPYLYSHNYPQNISGQKYWDQKEIFYAPKQIGAEAQIYKMLREPFL